MAIQMSSGIQNSVGSFRASCQKAQIRQEGSELDIERENQGAESDRENGQPCFTNGPVGELNCPLVPCLFLGLTGFSDEPCVFQT